MFRNKKVWFLLMSCWFTATRFNVHGQMYVHQLSNRDFNILHEITLIDSVWYFHAETGTSSRPSVVNTSGWDTLHNTAFSKLHPPHKWRGSGWFSLWVKADSSLLNKKLSFRINHDGASEIFFDGKPIGGYGRVAGSAQNMEAVRALRELIPIWFSDNKPHLITIHYSNFFGVYPDFLGFQVWIGDFDFRAKQILQTKRLFGFVPIFAATELILGSLHLLLFLFYPSQKRNLYYAIFVLLVGVNGIGVYFYYLTPFPSVQYYTELLTQICKVLLMWSGVGLLYTLNYSQLPRWRLTVLGITSFFYLAFYLIKFFLFPGLSSNNFFPIIFFICVADGFWFASRLLKKLQQNVWLIIVGVIAITLVYFFIWEDVFRLWPYERNALRVFVMSAGNLILPLCLSLYLALDFAQTNHTLVVKLAEVESLSAQALAQEMEKSERMAEEARRLEDLVQLRTAELSEKAERLKEIDIMKSRFFTNITHEFRTPLTLIINPVKELIADTGSKPSHQSLQLILKNATRLLQLINQLLDLSKLENGLMEVTLEPLDLVALINEHIEACQSTAISKGIVLRLVEGPEKLWITGDKDKLDKIISNLLSNALKFTPEGKIELSLQQNKNTAVPSFILIIRDSGQGIPAAKLPHIFSRFYQADPSGTRSVNGTGIGLAIVKELVELLNGNIHIQSVYGLFTEATLQIPYHSTEAAPKIVPKASLQLSSLMPGSADAPVPQIKDGRPILLLIEDHHELQKFIQQMLSASYQVLTASSGTTGLTMALEEVPNLIITDLMMPGLDGYQLSSKLKSDAKTSHIPIIILTAKADMDSKVHGIKTGADAYLEKPFDQRELLALIENLLSNRNHLRERYLNTDRWTNEVLAMPSIEQNFIARVRAAVESHLNSEGYSADQLAADLNLSRTQLHRKLKSLIGQTPGELIRVIRLQYAHDLLKRRAATVSEVAYMVGFSSPASFSASFSQHFGFTPKTVNPLPFDE